jgi:hypothetical protein
MLSTIMEKSGLLANVEPTKVQRSVNTNNCRVVYRIFTILCPTQKFSIAGWETGGANLTITHNLWLKSAQV